MELNRYFDEKRTYLIAIGIGLLIGAIFGKVILWVLAGFLIWLAIKKWGGLRSKQEMEENSD